MCQGLLKLADGCADLLFCEGAAQGSSSQARSTGPITIRERRVPQGRNTREPGGPEEDKEAEEAPQDTSPQDARKTYQTLQADALKKTRRGAWRLLDAVRYCRMSGRSEGGKTRLKEEQPAMSGTLVVRFVQVSAPELRRTGWVLSSVCSCHAGTFRAPLVRVSLSSGFRCSSCVLGVLCCVDARFVCQSALQLSGTRSSPPRSRATRARMVRPQTT